MHTDTHTDIHRHTHTDTHPCTDTHRHTDTYRHTHTRTQHSEQDLPVGLRCYIRENQEARMTPVFLLNNHKKGVAVP